MQFELKCPLCHKAVTIVSEVVGQLVACPHCDKTFHVVIPGDKKFPIAVATPSPETAPSLKRFTFACQRCGSTLEAFGARSGQPGRCPTCGAVFVVPAVDPNTGRAAGPAAVADDGQLPTPMHAYATAGASAPRIFRRPDGTQVIVCPRCRREMPVEADTCGACGLPFTLEGAPPTAAPDPGENSLATAALTVGILAALSFCLPLLGPVAIGLGIAGWRRSNKVSQRGAGRNMAVAGIILGSASIALFVVFRILGNL
jgi:ribosomal protein L37E